MTDRLDEIRRERDAFDIHDGAGAYCGECCADIEICATLALGECRMTPVRWLLDALDEARRVAESYAGYCEAPELFPNALPWEGDDDDDLG